ncbi:unnamed protein product [Hermetia illucens]|uniref:Uncharacterized protein n=1 Tax=Hermetia illucens TaxID=343691 RepID=A0A7R8V5B4_HERIL|nr:unnamed protein product [Hermetia illucens]
MISINYEFTFNWAFLFFQLLNILTYILDHEITGSWPQMLSQFSQFWLHFGQVQGKWQPTNNFSEEIIKLTQQRFAALKISYVPSVMKLNF